MANAADLRIRITADGTQAIQGLNQVNGALQRHAQAAAAAERHAAALRGAFVGMAQAAAAAVSVGAMAQAFIKANIESERLVKGLTAVAGSSALGAQELAYIKVQADRLGISVNALGTSYVSLLAATKNTAMEGEATRKIFESVSLAMAKLGKSSADAQGALTAIQQSISKQKVSAEELTQQLGERLPGATKAFADSLGVTTAELMDMMSKGELSIDMWEKFAGQLNKIYDDGQRIGGLTAEWERFNNALNDSFVALNKATGATDILAKALANAASNGRGLASWLNNEGWNNFSTEIDRQNYLLGERIRLTKAFNDKAAEVAQKDAWGSMGLESAQAELRKLGSQLGEVTAKMAGAAEANKQLAVSSNQAKTGIAGQADAQNDLNAQFLRDEAIFTELNNTYDQAKEKRTALQAAMDALDARYDKGIANAQKLKEAEELYNEAAAKGLITKEQAAAKISAYAAGLEKATEASRSHTKALSAEAQVVAQVEQKYGLMAGQLDAVWKLESSRGKTAGTSSERWVKDLAAGEGHMTKIVGQFQMAESTAKGLGANMATFNGQADAAGKYLAEAAAKGKTLWEQFAYYHGGPNEKAWGEKTRAYADAAVKIVADATGQMEDLGQNTGKAITDALDQANAAVQNMIRLYLPAEAAAMDYAQSLEYLANSSDFASLSQEKQAIILQGLQKDFEKSKVGAAETADAWAEVWKNAVKRIDDTFAGLWKDLFSGTKSTLESMKAAILSWLAEVAHALITKPLVVAITTGMMGGSAPSVAGAAGTAGQAVSGLSSFSSIGSMFSTAFSLGSTFLSGVSEGIMGMFSTNMFSTIGTAWGAATSGSSMGLAAGAGVMAAYALPVIAAAAVIFAKYQKDQKPRYGAYGATTNGRTDLFEDGVGVSGRFGLAFGMNDRGTANVDAEEMRQVFEGFAKVSEALADFYGKDVEEAVKASLAKASMENWGKNGLMNYAMSAEEAFRLAFEDIIKHAAATGDDLAVVMSAVVGGLSGSMEQMAGQIELGMQSAKAALAMAEAFQDQEIGRTLELDGALVDNALKLVGYAKAMQKSGETTADAMARMATNLTGMDAAITLTGTSTAATGEAFVTMANNLATAADEAGIGMEGLMKLQTLYYEQFYSATERATKTMQDLLKGLNKEWPKLKEKLLGINQVDKIKIEIPELKTLPPVKLDIPEVKQLFKDPDLADQLERLSLTIAKKPFYDPDLADQLGRLSLKQPVGSYSDPSLADELERLRPPSRQPRDTGGQSEFIDYDAMAKESLRAAQMYIEGVNQGTITKSAETEAKIQAALDSYADEIKRFGIDVSRGLMSIQDQINTIGNIGFMTEADRQSLQKDPNAEIYAQLVNDMPKSRDEFEKLIGQIDVTTQGGALLYAEIMKLVPAFDAMYDSIENFEKWLGVTDDTALATQRLQKVFADLGLDMPTSKNALLELYNSGKLTADMMAVLGVNLEDLSLVFKDAQDAVQDITDTFAEQRVALRGMADQLDPPDPLSQGQRDSALAALRNAGYEGDLYDAKGIAAFLRALAALDDAGGEAGEELQKFIDTFTGVFDELARISEERAGLEMRLLELTGTEAEILAARRQQELEATDASNRAILARIYQLEDEAAALEKAKAAAEAAEAARRAAYDKEVEAINEYNAAAQKAADEANEAARAALQALQDAAEAAYQTADAIANAWIEALSAAGLEAEATALSRRLQAAAMDPALRSVYAIVWQIQDAAERAAAQGDLAIQALGYLGREDDATAAQRRLQLAATDPGLRAMQQWVWKLEDAREAADKAGEAIQTLIDGLQAVSAALDDTINAISDLIMGSSPEALAQTRQAAQRDLAAQLAAAQAGKLPTTASLEDTLATLAKDPAGQFGNRTAYLRDLGRTRGQLASLKNIVDQQIPIEEQNLAALKNLPVALYPNFETIVTSIGKSEASVGGLLSSATAAVEAAISAMQARDDAMAQSVQDIVPTLKEIPPYIEDVQAELLPLQTLAADMAANLGAIDLNIDGLVSYDEFSAWFGNLMSAADMKAYFNIFDGNGDGMIDRLELIKANTAPLITIVDNLANKFATIDLNVNGTVTWEEFNAFFGKFADKEQLAVWYNAIDANGDGIISELEAASAKLTPLAGLASSIVQGMSEIDLNIDGMVSYDEFTALFGGLASDAEMAGWFAKLDLNGNGILDRVELIKGSLNITQALAKVISDNLKAIDIDLDGLVSYEEYAAFFGDLATDAELKAGFFLLDKNEDGILSKLEQQYITLGAMSAKIADEMEKVDLNVNGTVEYSEFATFFAGLASKNEMQSWFDRLDTDQNGLLSEAEITNAKLNNQIVNGDSLTGLLTSIRDYIGPLENGRGVNGILMDLKNTLFNGGGGYSGLGDYLAAGKTYAAAANDYLKTGNDLARAMASTLTTANERLGVLENGRGVNGILIDLKNTLFNGGGGYSGIGVYLAAITTTLATIATNTGGSAPPDSSGTLTNILNAINTGNGYLNNIRTSASSTVSALGTSGSVYQVLIDTKNTLFNGGGGYSGIGLYLAAMRNNLKRLVDAGAGVGGGYATGGIASGPASGYQALLHGTEAVIPLGDGNSVTAHLTAPLPPAPNLIHREAGDNLALRQALAELQAEVQALRSDQQSAAAATVGELRDHNRRERKRDVVGQKVEVIS